MMRFKTDKPISVLATIQFKVHNYSFHVFPNSLATRKVSSRMCDGYEAWYFILREGSLLRVYVYAV
jgi:hypothetical protein